MSTTPVGEMICSQKRAKEFEVTKEKEMVERCDVSLPAMEQYLTSFETACRKQAVLLRPPAKINSQFGKPFSLESIFFLLRISRKDTIPAG
jgi:hypothetical protein